MATSERLPEVYCQQCERKGGVSRALQRFNRDTCQAYRYMCACGAGWSGPTTDCEDIHA